MRTIVLSLACGGAALLAASGCSTQTATNNSNSTANSSNMTASRAAQETGGLPPASSAHGGGSPIGAASPAGANGSAAKPSGVDTAVLDAKVEKADAKAKAAGASQADKLAAAAALVERGNVYRDAGSPQLYKFALGDYRRALRYQPDNAEAREKMSEIVGIYQSMGRPVPENGNEP